MSIKSKITKYIRREAARKSIYVWSAQGQRVNEMNYDKISEMETSPTNVERIINHIIAFIGLISKYARCFDCSGLIVFYFLKYKLIAGDMTADGLYRKWPSVALNQLQEGDLVYELNSSRTATHVGYYVGDNIVVEARGRDYGVVETDLNSRNWKAANRPTYKKI